MYTVAILNYVAILSTLNVTVLSFSFQDSWLCVPGGWTAPTLITVSMYVCTYIRKSVRLLVLRLYDPLSGIKLDLYVHCTCIV